MKNIVITGGTGFLGKRLCEKLLELGYNVKALGRDENIGEQLKNIGIDFDKVDLLEREKLENSFDGADIVFHCAAKSSLWGDYDDFYNVNVIGTKNVIDGVKNKNVKRLIYISSPTIYYNNKDLNNFKNYDEKPDKFVNYYAQTKWYGQEEIDKAFGSGVNTISIIPRGIFGPGDTSVFPRLLRVNEGFGVPLINNGKHLIELTYVDNVVDSLILCVNSDEETFGKKYFITNGETFEFKKIMTKVFDKLGVKTKFKKRSYIKMKVIAWILENSYRLFKIKGEPILTRYSVEILYRNQTFDMTNTIKELGYKPRISVEEGIEKFSDWWVKNGKKV